MLNGLTAHKFGLPIHYLSTIEAVSGEDIAKLLVSALHLTYDEDLKRVVDGAAVPLRVAAQRPMILTIAHEDSDKLLEDQWEDMKRTTKKGSLECIVDSQRLTTCAHMLQSPRASDFTAKVRTELADVDCNSVSYVVQTAFLFDVLVAMGDNKKTLVLLQNHTSTLKKISETVARDEDWLYIAERYYRCLPLLKNRKRAIPYMVLCIRARHNVEGFQNWASPSLKREHLKFCFDALRTMAAAESGASLSGIQFVAAEIHLMISSMADREEEKTMTEQLCDIVKTITIPEADGSLSLEDSDKISAVKEEN